MTPTVSHLAEHEAILERVLVGDLDRDDVVVQSQIAQARGKLDAARALFSSVFEEMWQRALDGEYLELSHRARIQLACSHGIVASAEAVREAVEAELGEEVGGFYRAGERFQRSMVDGVSRLGQGAGSLRPDRVLSGASELLEQSARVMAKAMAVAPEERRGDGEDETP